MEMPVSLGEERNFSEETARAIDAEVRATVERGHQRALAVLRQKKHLLERIATQLLEVETLERSDLEAIMRSDADGAPSDRDDGKKRAVAASRAAT